MCHCVSVKFCLVSRAGLFKVSDRHWYAFSSSQSDSELEKWHNRLLKQWHTAGLSEMYSSLLNTRMLRNMNAWLILHNRCCCCTTKQNSVEPTRSLRRHPGRLSEVSLVLKEVSACPMCVCVIRYLFRSSGIIRDVCVELFSFGFEHFSLYYP